MSENNMPERFEDAAADPTSRKRGGKWWTRRPAVIAGVAAGLLAVSGTAFAYWTSTGSGSGSGTTGAGITVTINQTSTVTAMAPGVPAQALSGTFTASQPTYVGQVTAAVTGTTDAGCDATNFTIVQPTATNAEVTTGSTWAGGSIAFNNKAATNQDACKGVTVTIGYTSN
jgi:hypothetical protein